MELSHRLLSNRISAKRARVRKEEHVVDLEKKLKDLEVTKILSVEFVLFRRNWLSLARKPFLLFIFCTTFVQGEVGVLNHLLQSEADTNIQLRMENKILLEKLRDQELEAELSLGNTSLSLSLSCMQLWMIEWEFCAAQIAEYQAEAKRYKELYAAELRKVAHSRQQKMQPMESDPALDFETLAIDPPNSLMPPYWSISAVSFWGCGFVLFCIRLSLWLDYHVRMLVFIQRQSALFCYFVVKFEFSKFCWRLQTISNYRMGIFFFG